MFFKRSPSLQRLDRVTKVMAPKPSHPAPKTARAERDPIYADCTITYPFSGSEKGVALDISASGIRVRFRHKVVFPQMVLITVPSYNIKCEAYVVRSDYFDVAFKFIRPQLIK